MYNHASKNYICPICLAVRGVESEETWIKQADIFYQDELVLGFVSSKAVKGNEGHPILVPKQHFENLYDLPENVGHALMDAARKVAVALKEVRKADGVTLVQNNEPAGDQHVLHYHLHIVPRFEGDHFHEEMWKSERSVPESRVEYAEDLRAYFQIEVRSG